MIIHTNHQHSTIALNLHPWKVLCIVIHLILVWCQWKTHIVSWEPEGRYCRSTMFRWEPEGRYSLPLTLYSDRVLLVLNKTSLSCNNALLALNWRYTVGPTVCYFLIFIFFYYETEYYLLWSLLLWSLYIKKYGANKYLFHCKISCIFKLLEVIIFELLPICYICQMMHHTIPPDTTFCGAILHPPEVKSCRIIRCIVQREHIVENRSDLLGFSASKDF